MSQLEANLRVASQLVFTGGSSDCAARVHAVKAVFFVGRRNAIVGRDLLVVTATGCRLDGPGIECRWGRNFPHSSRPAVGPTQRSVQLVYRVSFPGVKRPGRGVDPPHLAPRFKKE